ncbi:hypothetical protein LBMAG56_17610 [Verrucomicrobiota bacterium]|nr:hypothetical protein LBMAG56_17610 [Verrucomicrobiota bacterium]
MREAIDAQIPPARPAAFRIAAGHETDDPRGLIDRLDAGRAALEIGGDAQVGGGEMAAKNAKRRKERKEIFHWEMWGEAFGKRAVVCRRGCL